MLFSDILDKTQSGFDDALGHAFSSLIHRYQLGFFVIENAGTGILDSMGKNIQIKDVFYGGLSYNRPLVLTQILGCPADFLKNNQQPKSFATELSKFLKKKLLCQLALVVISGKEGVHIAACLREHSLHKYISMSPSQVGFVSVVQHSLKEWIQKYEEENHV